MKRVLTFATTGLFLTGLALLPLSARADQTVSGKDGKTAPAAAMPGSMPAASGPVSPSVKDDGKKASAASTAQTARPGVTAPAAGAATVKPSEKSGS